MANFDGTAQPDPFRRNKPTAKLRVRAMNGPAQSGAIIPAPDHAPDLNRRAACQRVRSARRRRTGANDGSPSTRRRSSLASSVAGPRASTRL